jgi:hypothetical protein
LFVALDKSRKTICLGKIDRQSVVSICRQVEAILAAKFGGHLILRDPGLSRPIHQGVQGGRRTAVLRR